MTPSRIEIQPRDLLLLEDLFVSRVMSLAHIAALHFEGRAESAKKRIQKLKATDLIGERPRKARDPGILTLTKAGYDTLKAEGRLSPYPALSSTQFSKRASVSELTIRHELAVMDAKAAISPAIRNTEREILEFCTWPLLNEFDAVLRNGEQVRLKPDGFLAVHEKSGDEQFDFSFFLEIDRGSETVARLIRKAECYRAHYASGGFAISRGGERSEYREYPFRVLFILNSETRLENVIDELLDIVPPIETQVWLTTMTKLEKEPLGAIWSRPKDHQLNVSSTRTYKSLFED